MMHVETIREGQEGMVAIETELDCQRVQERIDLLLGCLEESAEEAELIALTDAFEEWERKRWLQ